MNPLDLLRKAIGRKTPITPGQIASAINGANDTGSTGGQTWMGPMAPIPAQQQEVAGRAWDFPVGLNLQYTPRGTEAINFDQLRALADNYDLIRLLIETRKDQMVKIKWVVQPIDPKQKTDGDKRIDELAAFLRMPDKRTMWQPWLRALLEDMLVIDAATVYPRMTRGGDLYSLELLDGASIKRVIDDFGRQPLPPDPAFQQILKGVPAADYTSDELIYVPRNIRTHKLYGLSPVEQVVMTVNIGLRRQLSQLQYYTEGSAPDLIFSVPATWNPDQIKMYQTWWDSTLSGNTGARRGTKFVPDGMKPFNTKEQALKDEYDEWIARVCCFAFSIPPTPFIKQMNRATAETSQQAALSEGLTPLMQWVKDLMDRIIWQYFGYQDLCFEWQSEEEQDPATQETIMNSRVRSGRMTINESRAAIGEDSLPGGDELLIYTGTGAVRLQDVVSGAVAGPVVPDDAPKPDDSPEAVAEKLAKASKKKALKPINRERASVVKARKQLTITLTDFFGTQAGSMSDQVMELREADPTPDVVLSGLDFSEWESVSKTVSDILAAISKDGGEEALIQIGQGDNEKAFSVVNDKAVTYAKDRAADMVGMKYVDGKLVPNPDAKWQITESTREMLRGTVEQAEAEGWSTKQVADAIKSNYAFSDSRAKMIARTEVRQADVSGNMIGYRASGVVAKKRWLVGSEHDEDVPDGDDCDLNAEQGAIDLDDVFQSGDDAPLNHPRCVCDLLPVVAEPTED